MLSHVAVVFLCCFHSPSVYPMVWLYLSWFFFLMWVSIWFVSSLGLLQIVLLWIFLCIVFLWDVNPGVGLLCHGVCGSSAGAAKEFSGVIVSSPTTVYDGCSLFHIILSVPTPFWWVCGFIFHFSEDWWHIEHFFIWPLAIQTSSFLEVPVWNS